MTAERRFHEKYATDPATGCWIWNSATHAGGRYGRFWDGERHLSAHEFSFRHFKGELLVGCEVRHVRGCSGLCVNPAHLELGSRSDNEVDKLRLGTAGKLDEALVREIRRRYEEEDVSTYQLAEGYPVTAASIAKVVRRETWGHVV